jgi:hypothetical protein
MAATRSEKEAFAERLRMAFARSRKRITTPTALANAFNLKCAQAAQKWLSGAATPAADKIAVLAEMLGVPLQWLRYGIPAPAEARRAGAADTRMRGYAGVEPG